MDGTKFNNPKDPLINSTDATAKYLIQQIGHLCTGVPNESVHLAANNFFINVIRQMCPTRKQAELVFDEAATRMKHALLEQHYDPVSGRRRDVFPFTQNLSVPFIEFKDEFKKVG